eukprot:9490780-Pyramimonas_sp.AAC.1
MDILIFTWFFSFAVSPVFPDLHECLLYRVGRPNCHPLVRSSTVCVKPCTYYYAQLSGQTHTVL